MFHEGEDSHIENYADDTTLYICSPDTDTVISKLQSTPDNLFTWLTNNHIKANSEKWHLLLSLKKPTKSRFGNTSINFTKIETLLGVLIDSELRFDKHISPIPCTKLSIINVLRRIKNVRELSSLIFLVVLITSCRMRNVTCI